MSFNQGANIQSNPSGTPSTDSGFNQGPSPMEGGANPFDQAPAQSSEGFQPAQPQQQQQQQQQGNPSGLPNSPQPPMSTPSREEVIPGLGQPREGGSPLDKYMNKPDNGSNAGGKGAEPAPKATNPFSFTNKEYSQLMGSHDFVGEITPEIMSSIQQGDVKALGNLINQAVINGGSMAAHFSTQIAQRGVDHSSQEFQTNVLPGMFKDNSFQQEWANAEGGESDILRHPSVEPMVEQQRNNFRQQFPDATPRQITEATRKYFTEFASAFQDSGNQKNQASQPAKKSIGDFFN